MFKYMVNFFFLIVFTALIQVPILSNNRSDILKQLNASSQFISNIQKTNNTLSNKEKKLSK